MTIVVEQDSRIIVALDDMNEKRAISLTRELAGKIWGVKVNSLYSRDPRIVGKLKKFVRVFVDMKIHDIPRSAALHAKEQLEHGADIINCHASGGVEMMKAIYEVVSDNENAIVIAVTVLTSLDSADCKRIYGTESVSQQVMNLAELTLDEAFLDGTVCSPEEVSYIKNRWGERCTAVTPGIRLAGDSPEDQKRLSTPYNAIMNGSDLLVVGSSITKAGDPLAATSLIDGQITKALIDRKRR